MRHVAYNVPRKLIGAVLVPIALAACELQPVPTDSAILNDALPAGTTIPAAWSTSGAATSAVKGNWVASFRDPNMTSLVREGLANNRDLVAAAARVEAALQTVIISGAPLLPEVGLEAGSQRSELTRRDRIRTLEGGVIAASWELDVWGKLRANKAASAALARVIADDSLYLQQSIAATVARSWIANIELARLIAVSRQATTVYSELLDLTDKKAAAGSVSDFDVVQARSRVAAAKAATSQLRTSQNQAIGSLEVLLGRYPSLKLQPASSFPRMPGSLPASGLPLSLLDRRPDVTAARNKVIAAFYKSETAKLARLPGISLSAAGGKLLDPELALLGANPEFLRVGISLLQPIFAGGALQADVVRMSAKQSAAVAEYGQTVLEAYNEVETSLANEKTLRSELANWRASLKDANEALEFANDRYIQGTIDMTGLLILQQFKLEREVNVIETEAALLNNRVLLYMALGESI